MKTLILICLMMLMGCMAEIEYNDPATGKKIVYRRWGDQTIEGLEIILADGSNLSLNKQKSEIAGLVEVLKLGIAIGSGTVIP